MTKIINGNTMERDANRDYLNLGFVPQYQLGGNATKLVLLSIIVVAAAAFSAVGASALPLLHPVFCDHVVLQRDAPVPIWGWTQPGAKVTVTFAGQKRTAGAGVDGKWMVKLKPMHASAESRTLAVISTADQTTATINDVLVGDVWLCSGQSNMEMGMLLTKATNDIATANFPNIRLLTVPHGVALEPRSIVKCSWLPCSPETLSQGQWEGFSAVGFYFGRELHQELGVPIGLVQSAWGGTLAEAWTSAEALATRGDVKDALASVRAKAKAPLSGEKMSYAELYDQWYSQHEEGSKKSWGKIADVGDWKTVIMPQPFSRIGLGSFDGTVWFRHEFTVPENWPATEAKLALRQIDDEDTTWINGVEVGQTHRVDQDRNYTVPAGTIKPETNVIAIRVLDTIGEGGLLAQAGQMGLTAGLEAPISLDGDWKMKSTLPFSSRNAPPPANESNNPNVVTYLFNGMIAPLLPYAIKGAVWYQGEANTDRAEQYHRLLPTMIQDWRTHFGEGNFPFYIVQLANYQATNAEPRNHPWAELREAQAITAKNVPHSGLALAIDVGDAKDIHPKDKYTVGHRLVLIALAKDYGRSVEYSGPTYRFMRVTGDNVRLIFDHAKGGLLAKGGPLTGFALAGADGKYVWAKAQIDGDSVALSASGISQPVAVRYAWDVNPVCNLYNQAGLPAVPFRTDNM
ncbi:MAG TPA: sialate O-acetylesterase [Verrucomicrobiae bacterium]|nr:sialate O-acetylesterase [Verrucomicrobiae bacterium]